MTSHPAPADPFPERLAEALAHLSPTQVQSLRSLHPNASGAHGLVAAASGMKGQSILSDILAGRLPGTKHRPKLAVVLGLDLAWLEGRGGETPDWSLPPVVAWRRFEYRLRRHAGDAEEEITERAHVSQLRRIKPSLLANAYGLDARGPLPQALAAGRYTEVPFELILRHALQCGLAEPTHPEHLAAGHAMWKIVRSEVERARSSAKEHFSRFVPPPRLFEILRRALLAQRQQGRDSDGIADALEMLWRQQDLRDARPRSEAPEGFQADTGRGQWSRLDDLRLKWKA